MVGILLVCADVAFAQSDPTASFTAKTTQIENVSSIIGASILGIIDLWVFIAGAIRGQILWPWLILLTGSAIVVGTYSVWKPLLIQT